NPPLQSPKVVTVSRSRLAVHLPAVIFPSGEAHGLWHKNHTSPPLSIFLSFLDAPARARASGGLAAVARARAGRRLEGNGHSGCFSSRRCESPLEGRGGSGVFQPGGRTRARLRHRLRAGPSQGSRASPRVRGRDRQAPLELCL